MSSAVLTITARSAPISSCIPAASLAPPVPPASSATLIAAPPSRPVVSLWQPGELDPGVRLVADVDRDQQRGELLDDPRGLQRTGVDRPQSGDQLDQAGDSRLVRLAVTADEHVLVQRGVRVAEAGSADAVQGGDDGYAVRHHLLRLLCRRALPDAERAGCLAAHRGGERNRAVDQDLARMQRLAQVVQVLRLGTEGDGEEDDLGALGGLLVEQALDLGAGHVLAQLRRCLRRPLGRARADDDGAAGPGPAQRQAGAEGAGAADDRDRFELAHSARESMLTGL